MNNTGASAQNPRKPSRFDSWLLVFALLLAGTLTYLPGLRTPLLLDDYMHAAMADGSFCAPRGPFDLYDFVNDRDRPALIERGMLPWWTHPKLMIRFFRPLSSALRWGDQQAFGNTPTIPHLHSLAWWAVAVIGARALFRRVFSPRVALFATAIFALGPWHVLPIAWLANREALVTLAFGTFALGAYVRWREELKVRHGAMATVLFALTMLAGEYALCFGGYILAIEWMHRHERPWRRLLGVFPFALPASAYLLVRTVLGYGTVGSAFYADPFHDPAAYLRAAPGRIVTLLAEGWLTLGTNAWGTTLPKWALVIILAACGLLVFTPLQRAFAALHTTPRITAKWLLAGSLVALLPVLAVVAAPRLLGVSALGIASTVAILLDHAWFSGKIPERRVAELTGLAATLLGFAHLLHGPIASWVASQELRRSASSFGNSAVSLRARLPNLASAEVGIVRGMGGMFFGPFALDSHGRPPAYWRVLSHGGHALLLRRDARTLELVVAPDKSVYPIGPSSLFRSETARLHEGDEISVPGMRVSILEVGTVGPRRVRFVFDRDIDAAPLVWIEEGFEGFRDAPLPRPGFGAPFDP